MVTLFLFMFAALVALYPQGYGFGDSDLIWSLSDILGVAMGDWGRYLFLTIAIAALFSTALTSADGGTRLSTDLIHNGIPTARRWSPGSMYLPLLVGSGTIGLISTWFFETHEVSVLDFFFISAATSGVVMAIYIPVILYINLKYLPKSARPGPVNIFFVCCGMALYSSFAIYLVGDKVSSFF